MSDPVLFDVNDGVALLTLNRPDKLNALSYEVNDLLLQYLDDIEDDDSVRAVILTGAGDRAFSAGADIHEFIESLNKGPDSAVKDFVRRGQAMTGRMETFLKPIIAAVNGIAFGGGCEITEAVHLSIASEKASFAQPEINLGITPTFGGTQRLPRIAGRKRALEYMLTGETFGPESARELGLVNKVVPHEDLLPSAYELAGKITRHSALAIARVMSATTRGVNVSVSEGLQIESEQFARMAATDDIHEALAAWRERREPSYRGV